MATHRHVLAIAAALSGIALVATACGSSPAATSTPPASSGGAASSAAPGPSSSSASAAAPSSAASSAAAPSASSASAASSSAATTASLASICPNPLKIQLNWAPEAEQSAYYQLAASGGTINNDQKTYTAPLVDPFTGKNTDIKVEVIAGGPSVGYSHPEQLLYQDPSILLGMDAEDVQIQSYAKTPTIGVVSPMTHYANIVFWNPSALHIASLADIAKTGATYLTQGKTGPLTLYLESKGWVKPSQVDGSYQGSPARFIASDGKIISGGYATHEPFQYSHQLKQWMKPISYLLLYANGYDPYSESTFVTPASLTKYSACLKQVVPMIQKSQINYMQSPDRVNNLIVKLATEYNVAGGAYDLPMAQYAHDAMLKNKIISQPSTGAFGSYDMTRVSDFIKIMTSTKTVTTLPAGFSADKLATNQFIDPNVNMTFYKGPYNNVNGVITEK